MTSVNLVTNDPTAKRGFVGKVAVWLLLTLGAVLLALVVMVSPPQAEPAQAAGGACGRPEAGNWLNYGTVDLVYSMSVVCFINTDGTQSWWINQVRVAGLCSSGARDISCGTEIWAPKLATFTCPTCQFPSEGKLRAVYNHSFSTDYLSADVGVGSTDQLFVAVHRVGKGSQQGGEIWTQDWLTRTW